MSSGVQHSDTSVPSVPRQRYYSITDCGPSTVPFIPVTHSLHGWEPPLRPSREQFSSVWVSGIKVQSHRCAAHHCHPPPEVYVLLKRTLSPQNINSSFSPPRQSLATVVLSPNCIPIPLVLESHTVVILLRLADFISHNIFRVHPCRMCHNFYPCSG